jgi:hypothetical protein
MGRPITSLAAAALLLLLSCQKPEAEDLRNPPPTPPPPPRDTLAAKVPRLQTNEASNLSHFSVTLSGKLLDTVGSNVTELGFVIDTLPQPTTTRKLNKFSSRPNAAGEFSNTIIDLLDSVKVYVRAYAVNAQGVGYGNEVVFTTRKEKTVNGLIVLTTQEEVEKFGANNYTFIVSLEITGSVSDLSPLKSLSKISTSLEIRYTSKLKNLKGLENLEIVGYNFPHALRIQDNPGLTSLEGLNNLKIVRGESYIINNDSLTDLRGLDNYTTSMIGDFVIADNDRLRSLDGLNKLTILDDVLYITNNPLLTDVKALSNNPITFLGESRVQITNNASLPNVDGFIQFQEVDYLQLKNNKALTDVSGFRNLQTVKSVVLEGNDLLADLSAFGNLKSLGHLGLTNSPAVKDLTGFRNLESIGWLTVENNPGLKDFTGLEKVHTLSRLEVSYNNALVNFKGLNGLTKIVGNAYSIGVGRNDNLQSLTGLENLRQVEGQVSFGFNKSLSNFCALKPLLVQQAGVSWITEGNTVNPKKEEVIANCN